MKENYRQLTTRNNSLTITLLLFLVFIVLLYRGFTAASNNTTLLVFVALILLISSLLKRQVRLLSFYSIYLFAMLLTYLFRPIYLLSDQTFLSFAPGISTVDFNMPLLLVILFLACYSSGYFILKSSADAFSRKFVFPFSHLIRKRRLAPSIVVLLFVASSCYLIMLKLAGISFVSALADPFAFRIASSSGGSFYISAVALWSIWEIFYIFYFLFILIPGESHLKISPKSFILTFFLFLIFFTLSIPFGSRGYLLVPIFAMLWMFDVSRHPNAKPISLVLLLPVIFVMITFSGFFGIYRQAGLVDLNVSEIIGIVQKISFDDLFKQFIVRFDSFDFFASIVDRCQRFDCQFLYGRSVIDFLVQPIPRYLMPDKVYKTSAYLTQAYFPSLPSTFTPEYGIITELFINFGTLGVAVGGILIGYFVRILDRIVSLNCQNPSFILFCLPIVLVPLGILLSGLNSDTTVSLIVNSVLSLLLISFLFYSKFRFHSFL